MKKVTTCLLGLVVFLFECNAQQINITNIQLKGQIIEISYNILDERIDRAYQIDLYNSVDNFIQPMEQVSGDVGVDIKVGPNKKIIWNIAEELGSDYQGEVQLEVKGNFYVPFITIEGISEGRQFKRSSSYEIIWAGGRGDNILNFELFQGEDLVKTFEERPNTGNTLINIPSNIKPGDNYRFKISDDNNRDEVVFTNSFVIKRKFPLWAKVGGVLAAGVGTAILVDSLLPEKEFEINDAPLPSREQ